MAINFSSMSQIESLKHLGDGGEAMIYDYKNMALKIFNSKVDIKRKEKKVKLFIATKKKLIDVVIGPEEEVTVNGRFVGYAMRKISNSEDLHMLAKKKYLALQSFSNKDVLEIIYHIAVDLQKIHKEGILIGDISDCNFQICGKKEYFIDVDSWGIVGKCSPDAYTEMFTCPDSYAKDKSINFSIENEKYNFALVAFYILTRIHPFGGSYAKNIKMSTIDRMRKKISVLGKYHEQIKIPKSIGSWKWMSPKLEQDFIDIFENDQKKDITEDLGELLKNMKYCKVHDVYYYGKYSECPLCNANAKVKTAPVVKKVIQTVNGPKITIVFEATDCKYILSKNSYLNNSGEIVHLTTGRKHKLPNGYKVEFSDDGKYAYAISNDEIKVIDENNKCVSTIDRMHKSNYYIKNHDVYFVDQSSTLLKAMVTDKGNLITPVCNVYNPLFEIADNGKVCAISMYPKKAIVHTDDYNFEVDYTGRIREYAIKHDKKTGKWLFIYQLSNGNFRTMVFNKNKVEYDEEDIKYDAMVLDNIDFCNNIIFDPSDEKIIGTNLLKNTLKEFACDKVDENSKLEFTGKGFIIYNRKTIHKFG